MVKRFLREPLVHFVFFGFVIFALYALLNDRAFSSKPRIEIDAARIEQLSGLFMRTWARRPTPAELKGLVDDYVKGEIYYREAKALGLDTNDTVVRQRMRLKMDMLNDVAVDRLTPTDGELSAYLAAHADMFRTEPAVAFDQVYFSPDKRGDKLAADAGEQLQALRSGAAAVFADLGDATQLPASLKLTPRSGVARDFGDRFAAAIMDLPVGVWSGPVPSGYGMHLVRVNASDSGRAPVLADVREQVVREWKGEKRKEFEDRRLAEFAAHYDVVVARDPGPEQ